MKRQMGLTLLCFWMIAVTFVMGRIGLLHNLPFFPDKNIIAQKSAGSLWTMTHVLGKGCKCSEQVFNYLIKRGPQSDLEENVILLGDVPEYRAALEKRGFKVTEKNPRELATEKAIGVPFLLINSAKGEGVYAGGYASSMIDERTPLLDLQILHSLRDGKSASELPIFGCAVSQRMQKLIDPLELKYKESSL
jgi:hypothetical protein